jgi:hypothetical protein
MRGASMIWKKSEKFQTLYLMASQYNHLRYSAIPHLREKKRQIHPAFCRFALLVHGFGWGFSDYMQKPRPFLSVAMVNFYRKL